MSELIKIESREIGGTETQTVNARYLHAFLESKQDFSTWIKARIEQYGFVHGQDFTIHKFVVGRATQIDYNITIDTAKELSMVERNDKGKQARQYFIECERRALMPPAQAPVVNRTPEQRALIALMDEQNEIRAQQTAIVATQSAQQDSIKRLEAKQSAFEDGASYFTVIGYGAMHGIKVDRGGAIRIGKRAGSLSKSEGIPVGKVRDARFGQVNEYHESMLDKAFAEEQ